MEGTSIETPLPGDREDQGTDNRELCRDYTRGFCRKGSRCRYKHDGEARKARAMGRAATQQPTTESKPPVATDGTTLVEDKVCTLPLCNRTVLTFTLLA